MGAHLSNYRQMSQLQHLDISTVRSAGPSQATAFEGSRLVSCCPGLRSLNLWGLQIGAGQLGPLQALSGLHMLQFCDYDEESLALVCWLTRLRLSVGSPATSSETREEAMLQLTQLQQLTSLAFWGPVNRAWQHVHLTCQVSCQPSM
jgi:hypothetical protein